MACRSKRFYRLSTQARGAIFIPEIGLLQRPSFQDFARDIDSARNNLSLSIKDLTHAQELATLAKGPSPLLKRRDRCSQGDEAGISCREMDRGYKVKRHEPLTPCLSHLYRLSGDLKDIARFFRAQNVRERSHIIMEKALAHLFSKLRNRCCGRIFLDTQDPFSHTPVTEERVLITSPDFIHMVKTARAMGLKAPFPFFNSLAKHPYLLNDLKEDGRGVHLWTVRKCDHQAMLPVCGRATEGGPNPYDKFPWSGQKIHEFPPKR